MRHFEFVVAWQKKNRQKGPKKKKTPLLDILSNEPAA